MFKSSKCFRCLNVLFFCNILKCSSVKPVYHKNFVAGAALNNIKQCILQHLSIYKKQQLYRHIQSKWLLWACRWSTVPLGLSSGLLRQQYNQPKDQQLDHACIRNLMKTIKPSRSNLLCVHFYFPMMFLLITISWYLPYFIGAKDLKAYLLFMLDIYADVISKINDILNNYPVVLHANDLTNIGVVFIDVFAYLLSYTYLSIMIFLLM